MPTSYNPTFEPHSNSAPLRRSDDVRICGRTAPPSSLSSRKGLVGAAKKLSGRCADYLAVPERPGTSRTLTHNHEYLLDTHTCDLIKHPEAR